MRRDAESSDADPHVPVSDEDLNHPSSPDPVPSSRERERAIAFYLHDLEQSLMEATVHESQLDEALTTRALIGEAMGILMVQNRCSAAEAFETLKTVSQHSNTKLREVARRLVEAVERTQVRERPTEGSNG